MVTHPPVSRRRSAGLQRRPAAWAGPIATLAGPATAVIGWGTLGCGTLLVARRLGGAFDAPPAAIPWAVAAAGIGLVALTDLAGRATDRAALAARAGLVCGLAAVIPRPGGHLDWLALAALATVTLACVAAPLWSQPAPARRPARTPRLDDRPAGRRTKPAPAALGPGRLQQRLERYELPGGADCLRGRLNLALAAGSRTAAGHLGFCPAFAETPAVQVTTDYDGVEAVVVAAEVLPWGVRVECRLAEPAEEPLEIPVDVFVRSSR